MHTLTFPQAQDVKELNCTRFKCLEGGAVCHAITSRSLTLFLTAPLLLHDRGTVNILLGFGRMTSESALKETLSYLSQEN